MHLNPRKPNILADMQAAANGRDLRDGHRMPHPNGGILVTVTAKRRIVARKSYPYASERQVKRQQRQRIKEQSRWFGFATQAETQG